MLGVAGMRAALSEGLSMGCFSSEVHRDRRSRPTGAEGEVPQAPSNRSSASSPAGTRHDDEQCAIGRPFVLRIAGSWKRAFS